MEDKKINISYDTLFELLRIERSRTELQDFSVSYLEDIKKMIDSELSELDSLQDEKERGKKRIHLNNTLKMIYEIYERRERKIVNMAVNKSKTKSAIIDFSKALDYEKEMFNEIVIVLDKYRQKIAQEVSSREVRELPKNKIENIPPDISKPQKNGIETHKELSNLSAAKNLSCSDSVREEKKEENGLLLVKKDLMVKKDLLKTVKFLSPVPSFLGPELEIYGPFEEQEFAELPSRIADILIKKKRTEEIHHTQV